MNKEECLTLIDSLYEEYSKKTDWNGLKDYIVCSVMVYNSQVLTVEELLDISLSTLEPLEGYDTYEDDIKYVEALNISKKYTKEYASKVLDTIDKVGVANQKANSILMACVLFNSGYFKTNILCRAFIFVNVDYANNVFPILNEQLGIDVYQFLKDNNLNSATVTDTSELDLFLKNQLIARNEKEQQEKISLSEEKSQLIIKKSKIEDLKESLKEGLEKYVGA